MGFYYPIQLIQMCLEQILIYENKKKLQNSKVENHKESIILAEQKWSSPLRKWRNWPLERCRASSRHISCPYRGRQTSQSAHLIGHLCPFNLTFRRGQQWCRAPAVSGRCCLLQGAEGQDRFSSRMQAHPTLSGTLSLTFGGTTCSWKKDGTMAEGTACFWSAGEHRKCDIGNMGEGRNSHMSSKSPPYFTIRLSNHQRNSTK